MDAFRFSELTKNEIPEIAKFGTLLNPDKSVQELSTLLEKMFRMENYNCFGLFKSDDLLAVSSGWVTVRFYSGKQLEVDNVVVLENYRSQGIGTILFDHIENWAIKNDCNTVELNTFLKNTRSHNFYENRDYEALGYHYVKKLNGFNRTFHAEMDKK
ncbi:MAG: GNAT family N-acetyltransferase [Flavobacterium sp.]|uniref:GNAT family N-acetyltransferase n=1 Tax=Flavobacterium sp. TaxID=239 RepID=UPI00120F63C1|nr:GNAT family N-acetyltransferase [Flavobacterium sp.]RZJ66658.1 MAG: GNAT family N-acetyltransferase [Flavobacterium sp.]